MITPACLRRMEEWVPGRLREPAPVYLPPTLPKPAAALDDGTAATDPPPAHWSPPDDPFAAAFERLVAVHALSPYG